MNDIKNLDTIETGATMTSLEIAALFPGKEIKEIHRNIRDMFADKIADGAFSSVLRSNGQVAYYVLPELESHMLVVKHNIKHLQVIVAYWLQKHSVQIAALTSERDMAINHARAIQAHSSVDFIDSDGTVHNKDAVQIWGMYGEVRNQLGKLMIPDTHTSIDAYACKYHPEYTSARLRKCEVLVNALCEHHGIVQLDIPNVNTTEIYPTWIVKQVFKD